ncbi:MAG: transglycosylase SLT domain-containing protein [Beijerinckiaceae bacterium]|nr:transglycosylase SLT domain-containing protein [Beijerinckiaceae bacterium]
MPRPIVLAVFAALVSFNPLTELRAQEQRGASPPQVARPDVHSAASPATEVWNSGTKAATPFDVREPYRVIARREAARLGVPYELVDAVMSVESRYNPLAGGKAGEVGLMQVMPQTARLLGFNGTNQQLSEPETNIRLGAAYLAGAWKLANQDICTAVMKYRAGHNETRFSVLSVRYCMRVRQHLASLDYPVTGSLPAPTFGFEADVTRMGVAIGSVAAARRHATGRKLRSRVGWGAHDARLKALDARVKGISLGN